MNQEHSMTVRREGELIITPADLVENATTQAKLLMDIVEKTHCYQTISNKKYLQVEAWETIGAFNRVHAVTSRITPITRDGEVAGYQADVELMRDGIIVGGASMPCFFTENACKGKEGDAKHKACMSAAQTFATSKAYRMNYSYVAILAGYQPTPAEEMTGESTDDRPANPEHWCETHQTKWFKRGKMKNYAHPIEGTDEWCNEPSPETVQSKSSVVEDEKQPDTQETPKTRQKQVKGRQEHDWKDATTTDMYRHCFNDFDKNSVQVNTILEVNSTSDIVDTPEDCYNKVADSQEK